MKIIWWKIKQWYAKSKVEYEESLQKMYFTPIRKRNGLPDSFIGTETPEHIRLTTEEVIERVKAYQNQKISKE